MSQQANRKIEVIRIIREPGEEDNTDRKRRVAGGVCPDTAGLGDYRAASTGPGASSRSFPTIPSFGMA
jgi:hypothetical protein